MKICLGVYDVPEPGNLTSHELGEILEKKYTVFSAFADNNMQKIADHLSDSVAIAMENLAMGIVPKDIFAPAGEQITQDMKKFISMQEIEKLGIPGVPTQAALDGLTLRTKNGRAPKKVKSGQKFKKQYGPRRPSFMYSGIFEASLKGWVEE